MHSILVAFWNEIQKMSWKEAVAAVTGLISVILVVRNNIWTWAWGIVSVILYGIVFHYKQWYANEWLQFYYFLPISAYAWWVWLRCGPNKNNDLPVLTLSVRARFGWFAVTLLLCAAIVRYMIYLQDPNPYADGITTAISIVAQYLQARKWIENWFYWIAADIIYVFYLFPAQHLYATTLLYAVFLALAAMGWQEWNRIMRGQQTAQQAQMLEGVTHAHD